MKTRELRTGNIVLDEYLEEVYIIAIFQERLKVSYSGDNDESTKYLDISEIEPVLITPELLKKAGFNKRSDVDYYKMNGNMEFKIHLFNNEINLVIDHSGEYDLGLSILNIDTAKYFHHLQNLIFDLTGEEITI